MSNIQVRLPDDLQTALDELAAELHASRSEAARSALAEGLRTLRLGRSVQQFADGRRSLESAARHAGVSLHEMARAITAKGLSYQRQAVSEAHDDAEAARAHLRRQTR